jgi:hypothetical protein
LPVRLDNKNVSCLENSTEIRSPGSRGQISTAIDAARQGDIEIDPPVYIADSPVFDETAQSGPALLEAKEQGYQKLRRQHGRSGGSCRESGVVCLCGMFRERLQLLSCKMCHLVPFSLFDTQF